MKTDIYYTQEEDGKLTKEVRIGGITGVIGFLSFWVISILTYTFTALILFTASCFIILVFLCLLPFIILIGIVHGFKLLTVRLRRLK